MENQNNELNKIKFVLDHFKVKIYHADYRYDRCDFRISFSYTSDGHMLYDAKSKYETQTHPEEHLFYNNYDLVVLLLEEIRKGNQTIWIDKKIFEEALMASYIEEEYYRLEDGEELQIFI